MSKTRKEPKSTLGTKHFLLVFFVVIVAAASLIVGFSVLLGNRMIIPENGIYSIGEKFTYEYTTDYEPTNDSNSHSFEIVVAVVDFDGENYTLRHTSWVQGHNVSYTTKTDLRGNTIEVEGGFPVTNDDYLFPAYGSELYFPSKGVNVGDQWEKQVNMDVEDIVTDGTIRYNFAEVTNVSVPAGTYDVLKIETVSNLTSNGHIDDKEMTSKRSISGYILLEKDSHIVIKYETQELSNTTITSETVNGKTTRQVIGTTITQMQLTRHTR